MKYSTKETVIIAVAAIASVSSILYFANLPAEKQVEISTDLKNIATVVCSDSSDTLREYFLNMIRKEYPEHKIEDLCDLE